MEIFTLSSGVKDSLVAAVIFQVCYSIASALYNISRNGFSSISARKNIIISNSLVAIYAAPLAIIVSLVLFFYYDVSAVVALSLSLYSLVLSFYVLSAQVVRYRKAGILGLDLNISKGINYVKALNLTKKSLMVLGTGADKLTVHESEFLEAISSATNERPAKLLLCHPDSPALTEMAFRDNKEKDEYAGNVRRSIERLKRFQNNAENIEIRFYYADTQFDMPVFRLMFFNDYYCLCSFNTYGNKDGGKSAPQLHLYCPVNENGKHRYFKAFQIYFDDIWKQSTKYVVTKKSDWVRLGL